MASRSIGHLHPSLQPLCVKFLQQCEAAGLNVIITCTYRTNAEQEQLYALGRTVKSHLGPYNGKFPLGRKVTKARAGQSDHNATIAGVPAAKAFDIGVLVNGKYDVSGRHPDWQAAGKIGMALGMVWYGAPTAPFNELAHFALAKTTT